MDRLRKDLRYSVRRLSHRPGFTLIAVLSLALGIGANTAIFSLVQAVLLRDTPVAEPERVVEIYFSTPDFGYVPFSLPDYRDFESATQQTFSSSFGSLLALVPLDRGDGIETVPAELVTGDYFSTLGLQAAAGRLLGREDDVAPGGHAVAVLDYDYWTSAFDRDPSAIGRELRLNGRSYQIVGVAPRAYSGMLRGLVPSLYLPVMMINQLQPAGYDQLASRSDHGTFVRARLHPGVREAQVQATVKAFVGDMRTRFRDDWPPNAQVHTIALSELIVNPLLDRFIVLGAGLLSVVVGLVLLLACANLASFLLAQARDRQREIAIRLALGAGRGRLVGQLLTESIVLALIGGIVAVGLAAVLLRALLNADLPLPLPVTVDASLNAGVLVYAVAVSLLAGVLFGLAPALTATRTDVVSTIKNENTGGGGRRRFTLRNVLVVGQVAVSLVLLVTAGLLLRSLVARQSIEPGFGQRPTALLDFGIPSDRYGAEEARLFVQRLEERTRRIPGVQAVGVTGNLHLNTLNTQNTTVNVEGIEPPPGADGFVVDRTTVDPGFFDAAGIPIVRGRNFDDRIDVPDGARVAIINQVMAERFWPGQDPIGRTYRNGERVVTVIGVARNAKIRTLGEPPRSFVYEPFSQSMSYSLTLLAQTGGAADATLVSVLAAARELDRDLIILNARTMERHLAVMLLPARLAAIVFGAFASLALTLALVGVYGVVSYAVARRMREVGIRLSLGAQPAQVVALLTRAGLTLVAIGGAIGLVIALLAAQVLRSTLYGVAPIDPMTFTIGPLLLLTVGALASWLPARRASRVDPARVMAADR